jgi:hypothetical protein
MPDEPMLREQARAVLRSGKMPSCAICSELITPDQAEIEIEFGRRAAQPRPLLSPCALYGRVGIRAHESVGSTFSFATCGLIRKLSRRFPRWRFFSRSRSSASNSNVTSLDTSPVVQA